MDKENTAPDVAPGGIVFEIIQENAVKPIPVGSEPLKEQVLLSGGAVVPAKGTEAESESRIPFAEHQARTAIA